MGKLGKILGWSMAVLVVLLAVGITLTIGWRPFVGPRARALRGRYARGWGTMDARCSRSCPT
jgi:hypothetical protein